MIRRTTVVEFPSVPTSRTYLLGFYLTQYIFINTHTYCYNVVSRVLGLQRKSMYETLVFFSRAAGLRARVAPRRRTVELVPVRPAAGVIHYDPRTIFS